MSYRVPSPCVVRVAGLPVGVLGALRFDKTAALVDELLERDTWLATEGQALGELLYTAIGTTTDLKPYLVGLRRSVHSGRRPKTREWNDAVASALPGPVAARVRRWVAALADRVARAGALPDVLADETVDKTAVLRAIVAGARFRHGLAYSSPDLCDELERWLGGGKPDRQMLHRLARYVSRAATKTSPYSTFTSTGAGDWVPDGEAVVAFRAGIADHGLLDLHGAVLPQLEQALVQRPDLRGSLRVRRNPSIVDSAGRLYLVGPPPREPVLAVAVPEELRRCLDALDADSTVDGLRDRLTGGADDLVPRVSAYLDRLIEIGVLEARIPVPDQSADPLGTLAGWLESVGGTAFQPLATACRALRATVATPARPDDATTHRERLRTIQRRVGDVGRHVGLDWSAYAAAPVGAVHENCVYAGPVAHLPLARWRPALDDLAALRPWLGAHDPGLPLRRALGRYARQRFGPGATVPLLLFHHALREDPAAGDLRRLRVAPAGEPPDAAPEGVTCFVQPWRDGDEVRLVLNAAFAGPGRGRSRWLRLADRAAGVGLAPPVPDAPDGPVLAEVSGVFGMPFNVRYPSAPYEIDYPYTISDRPAGQRIPLGDLVVVHDPRTDAVRLHATGLDRQVLPVHTGLQTELLLPPLCQLLVRGFGPAPLLLHTLQPLSYRGGSDRVIALPREDRGRVTVARAAWFVPYPLLPLRAKSESDAGYLLRLRGWLRGNGIPERFFVQALHHADAGTMTKARKPLYVDTANWFLCAVFEHLLRRPADLVVFREALPAPENAIPFAPGDDRVTEVLVELGGGDDG
jgi:hypothetical protein